MSWRHDFDDEPVDLYAELLDGVELRKVDVFRDGHMTFAGAQGSSGSTFLSAEPWPGIEEIRSDGEFLPSSIGAADFESVWSLAIEQD